MIPIPDRMKHLKVDPRGLPIPYSVLYDTSGKPLFSVNDHNKTVQTLMSNLCSVCGTPLARGRWLVGGPLSAFHPMGCFIDPPMHAECCHYSLQVCPYLAAPHYGNGVGPLKFEQAALPNRRALSLATPGTVIKPDRPDVFIAAMAVGHLDVNPDNASVRATQPYVTVEYWKDGKMIERLIGNALKYRMIIEAKRALEIMPIPEGGI
jgi:hypothetical protein